MERNDAHSIEQVFAELSRGDGFVQIFICGGDHSHVNFRFFIGADRPAIRN